MVESDSSYGGSDPFSPLITENWQWNIKTGTSFFFFSIKSKRNSALRLSSICFELSSLMVCKAKADDERIITFSFFLIHG